MLSEDVHSKTILHTEISDQSNHDEEVKENFPTDQVICFSPTTSAFVADNSLIGTFEKSVTEQSRSNNLKELEIHLAMKKLELKKTYLALNYDLNDLERTKLEMERSKASLEVKSSRIS
ncbi:hypothetical protein K1719_015198 [Acacia pycnantha]|nr:hypothetical protein K1719_015198 [Acacia pycnantha]